MEVSSLASLFFVCFFLSCRDVLGVLWGERKRQFSRVAAFLPTVRNGFVRALQPCLPFHPQLNFLQKRMQSQEGEQRRRRWEAPPPYIRGETPIEVKNPEGDLVTKGDWACLTMGVRVRKEILSRVARDNEGFFERCPEARRRFDVLCQELDNPGQVRLSLLERSCEAGEEDLESWNDYMRQVGVGEGENGVTWLSAPWCLAEFLIYRRLAGEIFRYWDGESGGGDPFILQKRQGCMSSLPNLSPLCAKLLEKFPSKEDDGVTSLIRLSSFPFFSLLSGETKQIFLCGL